MSLRLTHCTLTGVDEATDLQSIAALSETFPVVEWGFLYSPKRQGLPGRYPSTAFLIEAFSVLPAHVRVALHFCGEGVFDLLHQETTAETLAHHVAKRQGRLQLNFNQLANPVQIDALREALYRFSETPVITQHNAANQSIWTALHGLRNHAVLFDASGGRGVVPDEWATPLNGVPFGYAGGIGPDNLNEVLLHLAKIVRARPIWVDMESRLRRLGSYQIDQFDVDRCEACLEVAEKHALPATGAQVQLVSSRDPENT